MESKKNRALKSVKANGIVYGNERFVHLNVLYKQEGTCLAQTLTLSFVRIVRNYTKGLRLKIEVWRRNPFVYF